MQLKWNLPEIKIPPLPTREYTCPAAPICKYIGNLREACKSGAILPMTNLERCLASAVILLGRIAGITIEPPSPSKEIQGFAGPEQHKQQKDESESAGGQ